MVWASAQSKVVIFTPSTPFASALDAHSARAPGTYQKLPLTLAAVSEADDPICSLPPLDCGLPSGSALSPASVVGSAAPPRPMYSLSVASCASS